MSRVIEQQILEQWETLNLEGLRWLLDVLIVVKQQRDPNLPADERDRLRAVVGSVRNQLKERHR